ncbi:hypothetical protein F4821DRAFT_264787 [Hypoxylon rubiginosum]|uniref:Uncharacterized protein n=1 Tax=Hypoxylon rubiginosum TaxID=110542 RepID=A0ACC0CMH7_9PEZI|nr:hypothetical protein F4821DRAFT_264787 [Hypoxylon rubiginosum]
MKFSSITIALVSVAASASAGCYRKGNGDEQGNGHFGQGLNEHKIIDSVSALLKGSYLGSEERQQCAMDTYNNKWKFYVKNTDGKTNKITEDKVKEYLGNEAYACQFGGSSTHDSVWQIISDPNPGECVSSNPNTRRDDDIAFEFEA